MVVEAAGLGQLFQCTQLHRINGSGEVAQLDDVHSFITIAFSFSAKESVLPTNI